MVRKVALITGGSGQGIGRSVALALSKVGYRVIINYATHDEQAIEIVDYINNHQGLAMAIKADIFDIDESKRILKQLIRMFGRIDLLYIGPGASFHVEEIKDMDPIKTLDDMHRELAPIYGLVPIVLKDMEKRKWGRIIAMGTNDDIPSPSFSYNSAKKARTDTLLKMSKEAFKHHITINVISPGPVEHYTSLSQAVDEMNQLPKDHITPNHIAKLIEFLASEESDFVTGNQIKLQF